MFTPLLECLPIVIDGNGLIRLDLTMQIKYILLLSVKEKNAVFR